MTIVSIAVGSILQNQARALDPSFMQHFLNVVLESRLGASQTECTLYILIYYILEPRVCFFFLIIQNREPA
jgi:hypothetical protein